MYYFCDKNIRKGIKTGICYEKWVLRNNGMKESKYKKYLTAFRNSIPKETDKDLFILMSDKVFKGLK